jgi:hypothetical protein
MALVIETWSYSRAGILKCVFLLSAEATASVARLLSSTR